MTAVMRDAMDRLGREFARRHHAHDTYREYLAAFAAAVGQRSNHDARETEAAEHRAD